MINFNFSVAATSSADVPGSFAECPASAITCSIQKHINQNFWYKEINTWCSCFHFIYSPNWWLKAPKFKMVVSTLVSKMNISRTFNPKTFCIYGRRNVILLWNQPLAKLYEDPMLTSWGSRRRTFPAWEKIDAWYHVTCLILKYERTMWEEQLFDTQKLCKIAI